MLTLFSLGCWGKPSLRSVVCTGMSLSYDLIIDNLVKSVRGDRNQLDKPKERVERSGAKQPAVWQSEVKPMPMSCCCPGQQVRSLLGLKMST